MLNVQASGLAYILSTLNVIFTHSLIINSCTKTSNYTKVTIIFVTHNLSQLVHVSIYLDHLQGVI